LPKTLSLVDIAYGSFLWFALVVGGISALIPLIERSMDPSTSQGIAMVVGLPLVLSALGAAGVGLLLAFVCWKELPLVVNAVSVVSLLYLFFQAEANVMTKDAALPGEILSLAVPVIVGVRWFAFVRPRAIQPPAKS